MVREALALEGLEPPDSVPEEVRPIDLTGLPIADLGPGVLLALAVILIVRGDLVPRKVHDEVRADRDRLQGVVDELLSQNSELIRQSELAVRAMTAIEREATKRGSSP